MGRSQDRPGHQRAGASGAPHQPPGRGGTGGCIIKTLEQRASESFQVGEHSQVPSSLQRNTAQVKTPEFMTLQLTAGAPALLSFPLTNAASTVAQGLTAKAPSGAECWAEWPSFPHTPWLFHSAGGFWCSS